jgi:acyl-CoA synthetase (AMP-forming)/AMP-acid ligase II
MEGLMQDFPLTTDLILRRCLQYGGLVEVVSAGPGGTIDRRTWRNVGERSLQLCHVLDDLGVPRGGRVGTFAWGSHRHVELHLAAPCTARVIHAVNVRLTDDQILYLVRHAGDEVLFVDASLTRSLAPLKDRLPVREFVVMEDGGEVDDAFRDCPRYEELIAAHPPDYKLPELIEGDAAWICYTSGTTGLPKGVVSTHRSVVLHAMSQLQCDAHAISRSETLLLATQMFHVVGWGLPYTCALGLAKLVLAGRDTSPEALARLIEAERVTVAAAVPTVWLQMGNVFDDPQRDLSTLKRVLVGGSASTRALIGRLGRRGVGYGQGWGLTEMSPSGTWARFAAGEVDAEVDGSAAAPVGIPVPGVEVRLVDEATGDDLPWDGSTVGELEVRGWWIIRAYLDPDDDSNEVRFRDGWLRTGDLGKIDPDGTVQIVDRAKDLIKSGGEWISSLELERILAAHPDVAEVAVVAMPHERWQERPVAIVVAAPGRAPDPEALRDYVGGRVAKWMVPDLVEIVPEIPKTSVGKYDKRALRARYAGGTAAT